MYYRFKELSELGSLTIKKIELLTFRNIVCKNNSMTTILEISKNVVVIVLTFKTHLGTFLHNCLFFFKHDFLLFTIIFTHFQWYRYAYT